MTNIAQQCPVRDLAERAVDLDDRLREITDRLAGDVSMIERLPLERERDHLCDRLDVVRANMEWARAESMAGIYAQLLNLRPAMDDVASASNDAAREACIRRFERLHLAVREGLERLGGFDPDSVGRLGQAYPAREIRAVLAME